MVDWGGCVVLGGWARGEGGLSGDVWVMGGVMGLKLLWCEFRRVGYGMVWYGGVGYGVWCILPYWLSKDTR